MEPKSQTKTAADSVPTLVSAKTLIARFGLTKKGVAGLGLPKVRIGRRAIRYRLEDVVAFVERRTVTADKPSRAGGLHESQTARFS